MDRTLRAALLSAFIAFAAVAGLGVFLGFEAGASLLAGGVAAAIGGLLLWGASRRADTFHPTEPNAHLRSVEPGFPGPPAPADPDAAPDAPDASDASDAPGGPAATTDPDDLTDGDDRG